MNKTSDFFEWVTKSFMQLVCLKHWFIIKQNKWLWVSQWIIYSIDLFKTLIHSCTEQVIMSKSLNHSLNIFIKNTDSWMKKMTSETLNNLFKWFDETHWFISVGGSKIHQVSRNIV